MLDLFPLYVVAISQEMGVKRNWGNSLGVMRRELTLKTGHCS